MFFDVDDTLVDFGTAARGALPAVLGAGVDYALWTSLKHYSRFTSGELDFDTMRTTRMADFLTMIGRPEDAPRAAEFEAARIERLVASYALYPDVATCLDLRCRRHLERGWCREAGSRDLCVGLRTTSGSTGGSDARRRHPRRRCVGCLGWFEQAEAEQLGEHPLGQSLECG